MKSSKHTGRKKQYLAPDTVELEDDEFSPSAPFSTGTIPRYRESSHYSSECQPVLTIPFCFFNISEHKKKNQMEQKKETKKGKRTVSLCF